ncbi:hypothetical protein DPMN_152115 [Dreissena polymorpha]|uniref:Uncharacterized protein n=1 Tax=Dreissena polymorpha TaxID=45954 RepID=A0A9D4J4V8_DREPO|nr:hypothetical protein DPMN_152115 [Dreissena polymorpha]
MIGKSSAAAKYIFKSKYRGAAERKPPREMPACLPACMPACPLPRPPARPPTTCSW